MARLLRCEFEGAIYHVMARGVERRAIFRDDRDRERFLEKLEESLARYHVALYGYTLMTNHYHLLMMTPRANLSQFMQQFVTSYTMFFNARHRRNGPLFAGRFKAPLVDGDEYLLKLIRYIHLNPVQVAALKDKPVSERWQALRRYRWSSHGGYGGWRRQLAWVDYGPVERRVSELMGAEAKAAYRKYVRAGLAGTDEELAEAMSRKAVGAERFQLWVQTLYERLATEKGAPVDVAFRRSEAALDPDLVRETVGTLVGLGGADWPTQWGHRRERDLLIEAWSEWSGLRGREIGAKLGHADGAVVSRRLRVAREEHRRDAEYSTWREKAWAKLSRVKA